MFMDFVTVQLTRAISFEINFPRFRLPVLPEILRVFSPFVKAPIAVSSAYTGRNVCKFFSFSFLFLLY